MAADDVPASTAEEAVPVGASTGDEEQERHGAVVVLTAGAADAPFTLTTAYVADGARRTSIVDSLVVCDSSLCTRARTM